MDLPIALLAMVTGYLLGSISFARLVTRVFAPEQDTRKIEIAGFAFAGRHFVEVGVAQAARQVSFVVSYRYCGAPYGGMKDSTNRTTG